MHWSQTKEWQAKEAEADDDFQNGRFHTIEEGEYCGEYMEKKILEALEELDNGECNTFDNVEDFVKSLDE
jgi:hypothetical protein